MNASRYFLLFLVLFGVAQSFTILQVLNGKIEGRGCSAVIAPKQDSSSDSLLFLKGSQVYQSETIEDRSFADLVFHLLGLNPINIHTSRSSFPRIDIFHKPTANLFISIDSVGEKILSKFNKLKIHNFEQKIKILDTSYPPNSLSRLTTLVSGVSPSQHGIISSVWPQDNGEVKAFDGVEGQVLVGNFADVLSQTFEGRSLLISFSGNHQFSSAICPHSYTLSNHPYWNIFCYYWNSSSNLVDALSVQLENDFLKAKAQVLHTLETKGITLESEKIVIISGKTQDTIKITIKDSTAVFSTEVQEDMDFLAELDMVQSFQNVLKTKWVKEQSQDDASDSFSINFSSLKGLLAKYGVNSQQFKVALTVLDAVIADLQTTLDTIYNDRVLTEVIFLGEENTSQLKKDLVTLFKNAEVDLQFLPFINLVPHKFEQIQQLLQDSNYQVYRIGSEGSSTRRKRDIGSDEMFTLLDTETRLMGNSTNSTITTMDLFYFQVCLWVPLTIAIVLIAFLYAFYDITDNKSDSLLYRSSSHQLRPQ